jgi:hypothetical protein
LGSACIYPPRSCTYIHLFLMLLSRSPASWLFVMVVNLYKQRTQTSRCRSSALPPCALSDPAPRSAPVSPLANPIYYVQERYSLRSAAQKARAARAAWFQEEGIGYFKQQSTRPLTLGYSLADSPSGLLAWIFEKLVEWTDDYPWTDDEGSPITYPSSFREH